MKKILVLAVVVLALFLGSCNTEGNHEITVMNEHNSTIKVYVTDKALDIPSSSSSVYKSLSGWTGSCSKANVTFKGLSNGLNYLRIVDGFSVHSVPTFGKAAYSNAIWTVTHNGTEFEVK